MTKGQATALSTNIYQNNSVWLDSDHLHCDKKLAHKLSASASYGTP